MERLKISSVSQGKGADRAGVVPGDVVETYGDQTITTNDDLSRAIQAAPNGGVLVVHRGAELVSLNIMELPLGITSVPINFDPETYDPQFQPDEVADRKRRREIESVIVTTTPHLDGYRVSKVIDVISAECVFGMNLFKDIFAAFSDILGGRSGVSQNALRKARQTCMHELKAEAHQIGANAVIGVALDYSELSGDGKSMLFLVTSGTAVVLEKIENPSV